MLSRVRLRLYMVFLPLLIASCLLMVQKLAFAENLTATTSVTVIRVSQFVEEATKSPQEMVTYPIDVELSNVRYGSDSLCWDWYPNTWVKNPNSGLNGRLWKFWSEDGYRTFKAAGWDWIGPYHTCKHRAGPVPGTWIGTMLSSLCDTGPCFDRGRTNIDMQNPANPDF